MPKRPETTTRCNCPFCTKRGALWAYQDQEDVFVLTTARDRASTHQWAAIRSNTITARPAAAARGRAHRFGIAKRPVPGKFKVQVNAWLLENFDPNAQPVEVIDGKTLW